MNDTGDFGLGVLLTAVVLLFTLVLPAGCKCTALRGEVAGLRGEAVKRNHAEWNRRSGDRHDHFRLETPARGSHHAFGNRTPK